MTKLELVPNASIASMGHIFCEECANESNIVLAWHKVYQNPEYRRAWDAVWHEFHPVRYVVPKLLMDVHERRFTARCPHCHNGDVDTLRPMDNGLLDLHLVRTSMKAYVHGFDCAKCEIYYASKKMGAKTGGKYICGDCAALA